MRRRSIPVGVLFAMPWILGFCVFLAYPLVSSLYYSFTNFSVLRPPHWIGVENYKELLGDEVFHIALKNTFVFALGAVPLATVAAIGLAMLLNTKVRGMSFYRTIFFVPSLVPMVALGVLWLWVFNGEYGLLNEGLRTIGFHPPNWLSDPDWAKWTLVIISVWGCGNAMVIYLAGLQDVPVSLYEAAEIDGAKAWAKTRHVTIPMISPVILFNVIMAMIGSLQTFALPYVMFPGGQPARSTYFFAMYLYDNAFLFQRMGYASSMGWVMFAITLTLTVVALKVSEKHVHYEG
jgi:multiple sugar transport system permease protein